MAPEPQRTRRARIAFAAFLLLCFAVPAHALRLVNYNVLNYPGTTGPTRDPFFRTILAPLGADVLITCEMNSAAGVAEFCNSLNTMEPSVWDSAAFIDGGDTDSGLFYKPSKVQFLGQWAFYPNPANLLRYVHVYRLKPVGYSSYNAEFRIYSLHLKASMGFEAQRLAECTGLRDSLNAAPPGTHMLVCGDFNFYTGNEPGLLKLLESQVNNNGRLFDPLGLQGVSWQDNTNMQYAWTQSPCKTGDTGCASGAATGGMDDRFDLILPTTVWQDGVGLDLVPSTYVSVGNDGLHHNNSIKDAPVIPEGATYANALHAVSDHLPVRLDLRLPALLVGPTAPLAFGTVIVGAAVTLPLAVTNAATAPAEMLSYSYATPAGFSAPIGTLTAAAGVENDDLVELDTSSPGAKSGTLVRTSNSVDAPNANIGLSGTVLSHAVASLDSTAVVTTSLMDFGIHASGGFAHGATTVHDFGDAVMQARLDLTAATIAGGAGHFSIVSGSTPQLIADVGARFEVAFDDANTTADSTYEATLTFTSGDEPLPGATAQPALVVTLRAQRSGGGNVGVDQTPPSATLLFAPFPNPLSGESTLRFDVARAGAMKLEIFDPAGRRVASLVDRVVEPGRYSIRWNGRHDDGRALGAGLYFVRMSAPDSHKQVARLAIVR